MAHGYLGDGYGSHGEIDPDSGDHRDRDRHSREHSSRRDDHDWRSRDHDRDRSGGMMFGDPDRNRGWSDDDRRSGRGDRHEGYWDEDYRREHGFSEFHHDNRDDDDAGGRQSRFGGSSAQSQNRRGVSAHPDDHYRSWRERHMNELDRDYQDYCRERESQFHSDFDNWRREKYGNPQPLRTGMTQSGISHDPTGMTQAAEDTAPDANSVPGPSAEATLGTNSGRSRNRG